VARGGHPGGTAWPSRERPGAWHSGAEWRSFGGVQGPEPDHAGPTCGDGSSGASGRIDHNGTGIEGTEMRNLRMSTSGEFDIQRSVSNSQDRGIYMSGMYPGLAVE
jgi:hypothetical protein